MAKEAARVTDPMRFPLTLTSSGRPVMYSWWGDAATAEEKFSKWIGSYAIEAAEVVLTERTGAGDHVLMSWPEDA